MVDAPYVVQATPARVELWTCSRIPFEAGVNQPWKKRLVRELKAATTGLERNGQTLSGTYAATQQVVCDTENTLFTNPGTAAFPASTGAIRWERDPKNPPSSPQPVATVGLDPDQHRLRFGVIVEVITDQTRIRR
jgi:hypothetical protein